MLTSLIQCFHALTMICWVLGIPFLFYHRWRLLSVVAAIYSIVFITINRVSQWLLGECVLTRLAQLAGGGTDHRWFTVKFSSFVFGFIPSNHQVTIVEESLIALVAVGVFYTLWWKRR